MQNVYSVFDKTSQTYLPPFLSVKDGVAIRQIQDVIHQDQNHHFARFSKDFDLVRLGAFDPESGQIDTSDFTLIINLDQLSNKE